MRSGAIHLGANPAMVGTNIQLNGEAYTVIGVMPPGFEFPFISDPNFRPQMWKQQGWTPQERAIRDNHNYNVVARLKPGVTLEQARAELNTISDRLAQAVSEGRQRLGRNRSSAAPRSSWVTCVHRC